MVGWCNLCTSISTHALGVMAGMSCVAELVSPGCDSDQSINLDWFGESTSLLQSDTGEHQSHNGTHASHRDDAQSTASHATHNTDAPGGTPVSNPNKGGAEKAAKKAKAKAKAAKAQQAEEGPRVVVQRRGKLDELTPAERAQRIETNRKSVRWILGYEPVPDQPGKIQLKFGDQDRGSSHFWDIQYILDNISRKPRQSLLTNGHSVESLRFSKWAQLVMKEVFGTPAPYIWPMSVAEKKRRIQVENDLNAKVATNPEGAASGVKEPDEGSGEVLGWPDQGADQGSPGANISLQDELDEDIVDILCNDV